MISLTEAIERVQLTREDERSVMKLEAVIDGMVRDKFDGSPLHLQFNEAISPRVAWAVQRNYERGGWKIVVNPGPKVMTVSLTPQMVVAAVAAPAAESVAARRELPPLAQLQSQAQSQSRLLVRMPTRGRPAQALRALEQYRDMAGVPIKLEVILDRDDETMLAAEVQQRLCALGCIITVDDHASKVEAVNGGRDNLEWDVLLLASDDMWPSPNYGARALAAMDEHFPHLDGAVYFDDGHQGEQMCTLPVIGRRWWEQQGRLIYSPEYRSLSCDVEQTELWRARGRLKYVDEKIIEHRHHAWGKAEKDELYKRNDALWERDQKIYDFRKTSARPHAQWGFDQPPLWLSVLVCSIPERRAQLEHLLDYLWQQVYLLDEPLSVEILVDSTVGITTGVKHQRLIERARAHFVAFCDDDDWVHPQYLQRIVSILEKNPAADCLSLRGVMTTGGTAPEPFYHSIECTAWERRDGGFVREPNHLNPVKRELALQTGFGGEHYVDDVDYGKRLRPLLKMEVSTGDEWLYLYFYQPAKSTAGGVR